MSQALVTALNGPLVTAQHMGKTPMSEIHFTSTWGFDLSGGGKRIGLRFERERQTASGRKGKPEHLGTLYADPDQGWPEFLRSLADTIEQRDGSMEAFAEEMAALRASS